MKKTCIMKRFLSVCVLRRAKAINFLETATIPVVMLLSLSGMSLAASVNNGSGDTRPDQIQFLEYPSISHTVEISDKSIEEPSPQPSLTMSGNTRIDSFRALQQRGRGIVTTETPRENIDTVAQESLTSLSDELSSKGTKWSEYAIIARSPDNEQFFDGNDSKSDGVIILSTSPEPIFPEKRDEKKPGDSILLAEEYKWWNWSGSLQIPDGPNGAWVGINADPPSGVPSGATVTKVELHHEITHPYIGNLEVTVYNANHSWMVRDNVGGSANNINETLTEYTIFDGDNPAQAWYYRVRDMASRDTGTLNVMQLYVYYNVDESCVATLSSPLSGAELQFPQTFTWSTSGSCTNLKLAFATSSSPATRAMFTISGSSFSLSENQWDQVKDIIGSSATFYWTIGESINNVFYSRASWRSFTVYGPPDIRIEPTTLYFLASGAPPAFKQPVSASPDYFEFTQPDGVTFEARKFGDEFYHWMETKEGWTIGWNPARRKYEYIDVGTDGRFVSTGLMVGVDDPIAAGVLKHVREAPEIVRGRQARAKESMIEIAIPDQGVKVSSTGTVINLVILANFSDTSTTYSQTDFNGLFNTIGYNQHGAKGSVRDYYEEVSYGNLLVDTTVSVWVTLPNTKAYYGANDAYGNDVRPRQMISDAIAALDSTGFDFSPFDVDEDGWIDSFSVIHQGPGEEASGGPDSIWSHKAAIPTVTVDGVKISLYHTEPELYGSRLTTIGVICHEFGHALGLPDLYDTDYSSKGIGRWGVMARGSWNDSGRRPGHFCSWSKYKLNWVTPTPLSVSQNGINVPRLSANVKVYKITSGMASNEYLLVENRQTSGNDFDDSLPWNGLLVYHIDENQSNNRNKNRYMVGVLQADGLWHLENNINSGDSGDPFPGSTNNRQLGPNTNPSTDSYYNGDTSIVIDNISDSADSMSFNISFGGGGGQSFTVFNDGSGTLSVSTIIPESPADWISWSPQAPFDIATGQSQVVNVSIDFNQAPCGETTTRLLVSSNDPDESPYPGGVFIVLTNDPCGYSLNIDINPSGGGTVNKNPDKSTYSHGEQVELTASANSGYAFSHWSGDASGTNNPVTVTMDGNKSVTANYAIELPTISVTPSSHDFGQVQVSSYADKTFTVENTGGGTLTGDASVVSPFSILPGSSYSLTRNQTHIVTVRFSPPQGQSYSETVTFTGSGGATRLVTGSGYIPLEFLTNTDSVTVPEDGTATFQVKLNAQPLSTVNASVSRVSGDGDITVQPGSSLTFTPSNWDDYQTVTLAAAEDSDTTNGTATIRVSASGIPDKDVTATEVDNDVKETVTINSDPDSLNAPWTLTGPNGYNHNGSGDETISDREPGDYTLTWGEVASWTAPSPNPETKTLPAGGSITFAGLYMDVEIWYVDGAVISSGDGKNWQEAFNTVQEALTASLAGDEIWATQGTYTPGPAGTDRTATFQLKPGVALYGGFSGTELSREERNWKEHITILSGDINGDDDGFTNNDENVYHVVVGSDNAIIDGFMIIGGNANGLVDDRVGGGIHNYYSSPTITNCTFFGNSGFDGGAINNTRSSPTITNCTFSENSAIMEGGGIYNWYSSPTITNCTFSQNSADRGGGICNFPGSPTVTNCVLWGNTALNTGHEIYNDGSSSAIFTYCNIEGCGGSGGGWDSSLGTDGGGNIDEAPLFVAPYGPDNIPGNEDDNFHLGYGSPCVNSGTTDGINPDETTDMGAFPAVTIGASDWTGRTCDFMSIQEGIDDIDNLGYGGSVLVCPGTYSENIILKPRVDISGESSDSTIIDGGGNDNVVIAQGNNCIQGFTIRNSGTQEPDCGIGSGSDVIIENNKFVDVRSGIWVSGTNNIIRNNAILINHDAGIIIGSFSSGAPALHPLIQNNTINGLSQGGSTGVIWLSPGSSPPIINNIIADFGSYAIYAPYPHNDPNKIMYNCFWNNTANFYGIADQIGLNGNIFENPLFTDPENNDYHLQEGSLCIDAGTNEAPELPDTDIEGQARIIDGDEDGIKTVDMGAYEYAGLENFVIYLNEGWNLISLCLQPEDTNIATVLDSISGKYASAWAFSDNSWGFHDPNYPGFSDLVTMEAGWGYWLNMNEAGTLTVSGSAPSNSINLVDGWNLVGFNSSSSQAVGDAVTSIADKYVSIWAFMDSNWKFHDPHNPGFSDLSTIDSGYGYWINATEACTWALP